MSSNVLFAKVLPPLKLKREVIYSIPDSLIDHIVKGSQVKINLAGREYIAVVTEITKERGNYSGKIKEIIEISGLPVINSSDFTFWNWIAEYYLCTVGEVYKAAYPGLVKDLTKKKSRKGTIKSFKTHSLPELSQHQSNAIEKIRFELSERNPVLLRGEPGSGKSELYFRLADDFIKKGKSTLLLLPEIAVSQQIIKRAQDYFPENLLIYNSRQTSAGKLKIIMALAQSSKPYLIIGVRSAILLPFRNLGLVIVDEEQDPSYKQYEPAPRFNARDASLILAKAHGASTIFGSSTPSFESLENMKEGKLKEVNILSRFHDIPPPEIKIVETAFDTKRGKMNGLFSGYLTDSLRNTLAHSNQALIISAKKYLQDGQISTKIIEEQIKELFPEASVARYDLDTSAKKSDEKRILNDFASHKYDILVSNRMTGKGFHFPDLNLAAILFAESLLNQTDFRSGERALQTIYQIAGRAGREKKKGMVIVQTASVNTPIFRSVRLGEDSVKELLEERRLFEYPPFIRMIYLTLRGSDYDSVNNSGKKLGKLLSKITGLIFEGPYDPGNSEKLFKLRFILKIPKSRLGTEIKKRVADLIDLLGNEHGNITITADVDPA